MAEDTAPPKLPECPRCKRSVKRVTYAGRTLDLDPIPLTYITANERHIFPEDGDMVVLGAGLVEHDAVCEVARKDRERQRQQYRQKRERQEQGV